MRPAAPSVVRRADLVPPAAPAADSRADLVRPAAPSVARRADLGPLVAPSVVRREPTGRLAPGELRELLERDFEVSQTLSMAFSRLDACGEHLRLATSREKQLIAHITETEERQRTAQQAINEFDHPVRRRLHREEIDGARRWLRQATSEIGRSTAELADIQRRLPAVRLDDEKAQEVWRSRPELEREHELLQQPLDKDLDARKDGLAAHPPNYLVDALGPRPGYASAGELWDVAAARIDQHRDAFGVVDEHEVLGPRSAVWDQSAFAMSQRAALSACDALDRSLGRGLEIEPPGLELGL